MTGEDPAEEGSGDVAGVPMKLFEMDEKSEPSAERKEELDEALEADRMSGALKAWTLVVDRSSVGKISWIVQSCLPHICT